MPQPPLYVINLDRSPDRLAFMAQQLSALDLSFERIKATDGAKLTQKTRLQHQQHSKQSWLHYDTLTAGEIGCALSWHKTWRLIAANNQPAVALEDDVKLQPHFKDTLQALLPNIDANIIIDLSNIKGRKIIEEKTLNGIELVRYQTPPLRNFGALYSPQAAQTLLKKIQHFKAPVDTLQTMAWLHTLPIYSLKNPCVSHYDFALSGSTITPAKKPLLNKIKKELLRPVWRGCIIMRNFLQQ